MTGPARSYPPLAEIERDRIADLLDADCRRMSCGPGVDPEDLDAVVALHLAPRERVAKHAILVDGELAGIIDFRRAGGRTHVGFCVHRDMRRRGVLSHAWATLAPAHGPVFQAACWADNLPARAALGGLGFHERRAVRSEHPVAVFDAMLQWDAQRSRHDLMALVRRTRNAS